MSSSRQSTQLLTSPAAGAVARAWRNRKEKSVDCVLGVWEGEFDADEHRARYRAYVAPEVRPNQFARNRVESAYSNMKEVE